MQKGIRTGSVGGWWVVTMANKGCLSSKYMTYMNERWHIDTYYFVEWIYIHLKMFRPLSYIEKGGHMKKDFA